jgi:hypothetical protein
MRKGVKLAPNNVVNPQAMYGDVDDISDDDEDDERISEEEEDDERISEEEEEEEEESDSDQEETHYVDKSKSSATAYNVEINVDDI